MACASSTLSGTAATHRANPARSWDLVLDGSARPAMYN
jgi:hypothetical protein